ncbi:MAG: outer membrane protein, partial [bacterium]
LSPDGLIGGVQGGYNWQMNSLVFGIEGDISFADWDESSVAFESEDIEGILLDDEAVGTVSADVNFLASVRGRLGFAMDSVLIYGTGGIAWADADAQASVLVTDANDNVLIDESSKSSFGDVGFVVGGGMAWMVIPQTFSVGLEGLYYFFDQDETLYDFEDVEVAEGEFVTGRATASLDDAWVIRARADFHF